MTARYFADQATAEAFADRMNAFNDGQDPEATVFLAIREPNGQWAVVTYYWSIVQQRRVYEGRAAIY